MKNLGWYPVNFWGGLLASVYSLIPIYIVYADSLGFVSSVTRLFAVGGMLAVAAMVGAARKKGHKLFEKSSDKEKHNGFTLVELLIVISIVGILSSLIVPSILAARNAAYFSRTKAELRTMGTALEQYANEHGGQYPADANRNIPPGIEDYVAGNHWPQAPWPNSIYDWDSWGASDLDHPPFETVRQISIRFCPLGLPEMCQFPQEAWAEDFDYYSSVYFCVSGPCRAHADQPLSHPGYCVNC